MMPPVNAPSEAATDSCVHAQQLAHRCREHRHEGVVFRSWGAGPLLLLVHGGVGSWTHWVRNIAALAHRCTVLALDLPGYGASVDVPAELSEDGYLDWVARAVRSAADGATVDVAGFSFGGTVAAAVAARLGAQGGRLSMIAPGGFGEPVGRQIPLKPRPKDGADNDALHAVLAFNLGQWMLSAVPQPDDPVVRLHKANLDRARYDSRRIGWRNTLLADLHQIRSPVQILWGDADRLAHPSVKDRLELCREARPDLGLEIVPDCGHWAQYERSRRINDWLLAFHADARSRSTPALARHATAVVDRLP
ncbi:MAG: alpha/beta fold hydrolase [Rhodoferax sp.]|nr:alpha/beta fold hydrolase [Rhodoferax sp.]